MATVMRLLLFNLATDTEDPILGFTTRWIAALAKRVEFIHVITMRAGRVEVPENVRVYSVGKEKGYSESHRAIQFYRHLFSVLRQDNVDACFSHMIPIFTIMAAPFLKLKGIPIITWYSHPGSTWTLKLAHHLSNHMVASIATAYPYERDKLVVVGQGIDTALFSIDDSLQPDVPPMLLCVGRLSPVKDHLTLINATSLLRKSWRQPFQVVILGGPATPLDEGYADTLHSHVKGLGLEGVVRFAPPVPMEVLPSWYRRCAALVNMTPTGSGDKVVWEAMACGRPCLVANEGFRDTLGGYADHLLFRYGAPKDLADRLKWVLSQPQTERMRLGAYLRGRVVKMHDVTGLAERLLHLFSVNRFVHMPQKAHKYNKLSNYYLLTRTFLFIVKYLHREILQHFAPQLVGLVLDLGCGSAPYAPFFANATRYISLDASRNQQPMVVANVQALPIAAGTVDSIMCTEVLEHVDDPDIVLREIARTLKPRGLVLITAPMSWNLHYEPHDFRRYTCYGLWQLLERHGFEVIETQRIGGLFSLVGSRLVEGIATESFRRLRSLPVKIRHLLILCYSIPTSLLFLALARIGDDFQNSDAIGWAVLAKKRGNDEHC